MNKYKQQQQQARIDSTDMEIWRKGQKSITDAVRYLLQKRKMPLKSAMEYVNKILDQK